MIYEVEYNLAFCHVMRRNEYHTSCSSCGTYIHFLAMKKLCTISSYTQAFCELWFMRLLNNIDWKFGSWDIMIYEVEYNKDLYKKWTNLFWA